MMTLLDLFDHAKLKKNYTYINDMNSAYVVEELVWKCVGLMLSVKLCVRDLYIHTGA